MEKKKILSHEELQAIIEKDNIVRAIVEERTKDLQRMQPSKGFVIEPKGPKK